MARKERAHTAQDIEECAEALMAQLAALPATTDASRVLETLAVTERGLAAVFELLAASHERAALLDLNAGEPDSPEAGPARWINAGVALHTAATLARGVADALDRARRDEGFALWFDDIETDRQRG